ncbi:hypothetical protein HID58_082299 [Brassica napus]|uniref:J domain-containing protein n=1 Tax=Brassica napus TaxID=3708 RepID=A0ABQ7YA58_BRANA|nr:hypothetical protein HID58_082299 [Brassica napus]
MLQLSTETPFRPREKLLEKQRLFQSNRHTYLKGPMDKVNSVAIPLALAASSLYMITTVISAASSSSSHSWSSVYNNGEHNHYIVLGIARNATQADVKRAYHLLARKFHPDVNKDSKAGELFKSIRCSYEGLSNEATRSQYDRALKHQENSRFSRVKRNYSTPDTEKSNL